MKRLLLSTFILVLSLSSMKATHLMGGEITMLDLGNNNYLVTLITYRDTSGIPMATTADFNFTGPNNASFTVTTPYDSIISGNLLPTYPYGTEIYLFMDTVTLPSYGLWTVTWSNCCRNGAINTGPTGNFYMKSTLKLGLDSLNSSPKFDFDPMARHIGSKPEGRSTLGKPGTRQYRKKRGTPTPRKF